MGDKNSLNSKLQHLVDEGLSIEDAASVLGLDIDSAKVALNANDVLSLNHINDTKELIKVAKPQAIKALISIGLNPRIENVSARVSALRSIAEFEDEETNIEKDKIKEIYAKMQEVAKKYNEEQAKLKETTSVIIHNPITNTITSEGFKNKVSEKKDEELCHTQ